MAVFYDETVVKILQQYRVIKYFITARAIGPFMFFIYGLMLSLGYSVDAIVLAGLIHVYCQPFGLRHSEMAVQMAASDDVWWWFFPTVCLAGIWD